MGCGTYRFTGKVSAENQGKKILLALPGLNSVEVPATGSFNNYKLLNLGEVKLQKGTYDLRVIFESGETNLDWFFLKKVSSSCN